MSSIRDQLKSAMRGEIDMPDAIGTPIDYLQGLPPNQVAQARLLVNFLANEHHLGSRDHLNQAFPKLMAEVHPNVLQRLGLAAAYLEDDGRELPFQKKLSGENKAAAEGWHPEVAKTISSLVHGEVLKHDLGKRMSGKEDEHRPGGNIRDHVEHASLHNAHETNTTPIHDAPLADRGEPNSVRDNIITKMEESAD